MACVDVIGIVKDVGEIGTITTKMQKTFSKRELTLVDRTEVQTRLTLWGKSAEDWSHYNNPVVAVKGAKVGDFGGRSLSMLQSSTMSVDPTELVEAHGLRGWFEAIGSKKEFTSQAGGAGGSRFQDIKKEDFKTLHEVKESDIGTVNEKGDYFTARGTIVHIKPDPVSYPGCPECNKKVQNIGDGWRCEKCDRSWPEPKYR
jgi:replication factor A1